MGPYCLPLRLLKHFSRREKQTTFAAIGALRVRLCFCHFPMWYPGSGVVLDCIDSAFLPLTIRMPTS